MFDDFFSSMDEIGRPSVQQDEWMKSCRMEMVTVDTIVRVVDECIASGLYALDLECTGLDNRVLPGTDCTVDKITGICLSPDDNTGYYIPVRHPKHLELCIPVSIVAREMKRLIDATENKTTRVVFHNGKFDQEFLQFCGWGVTLGEWDDPKCWDDTMILAYLSNTRIRNKGLKHLASEHLGVKMIKLQELFTREEEATSGKDFGVLDPSWPPTLWYACSDAICTRRLCAKLRGPALDPTPEGLPSQQLIYEMEKLCVASTRWMERNRVPINRERVQELIILGQREWVVALGEVYKEASAVLGRDITPGYYRILTDPNSPLRYDPEQVTAITPAIKAAQAEALRLKMDLNDLGQIPTYPKNVVKLTPKSELKAKGPPPKKGFEEVQFPAVYDVTVAHELGLLFREIGIEGLVATEKSGQAKTSKDELNRVIESAGEDMVFVKKIKKFREVAKTLASNLMPLYLYSSMESDPETGFVFSPDGRVKVNFEAFKTDTARFATPAKEAEEDDAGGDNFNGTIPWNLHSIPSGAKKGIPECAQRMREVIEVGPDSILVAIDFSGEELRVVTNVSGEPLWITEFFRCSSCDHRFEIGTRPPPFCPKCKSDKIGDIHTLTAIAINGPDIVNDAKLFKEKRGEAKGVNFGLCYGGGGQAVVAATGCSKEEGWRVKKVFDKTYTYLFKWWDQVRAFGRQTGHVLTSFNRRYPVPDINSDDGFFRSKAERNAVNGPIQATGADIMKLAMGLIYREMKKRGWLRKVRMIITIHDELVFDIDRDVFSDAIEIIVDCMINRTTAKLNWLVPLTVDIECGRNWKVPYNLTHMAYGMAETPADLVAPVAKWRSILKLDTVPENTADAAPVPVDTTAVATADPTPVRTEPPAVETPIVPVERVQQVSVEPAPAMPEVKRGDLFIHRINSAIMTMKTATRLSRVIVECSGRGTNPLRVEDESGNLIFEDPKIMVNPMEFTVLMNRRGSD